MSQNLLEKTFAVMTSSGDNDLKFSYSSPSYGKNSIIVKVDIEQNIKFYFKDFLSKFEQILTKLRIYSYLLKKFLKENFIFSAV